MPSIPDRIGGQGVIKVLSNISGNTVSRLLDLSDVDSSSLADGYLLEYNASTSKFITTDVIRFVKSINVTDTVYTLNIDASGSLFVSGISTFNSDVDITGNLTILGDIEYRHAKGENLFVAGVSTFVGVGTFRNDLYVGSDLFVEDYLVYNKNFNGPNGIGYFDNEGKLVSTGNTSTAIETSNFILTTDEPSGIVTWTSIIDGGVY